MESQEEHIRRNIHHEESGITFYGNSIHKKGNAIIAMARDYIGKFLMVISSREDGIIAKFSGEQIGDSGVYARKCPMNAANAAILRELFPWTSPVSLRGRKTTIGCGDRLGWASPGQIAAIREFDASPVLAQQSMRELKLTGRSYREVVDDTCFLVYQSGYKDGYGADGDHLKTIEDINVALGAGMPMITLDLSEEMLPAAGQWSEDEVQNAFCSLPENVSRRIEETYAGKTFQTGTVSISFDRLTAKRCAVMYLKALDFAAKVHEHIRSIRGDDFDLEISIDETTSPTLPEHHYFIVRELQHRGVGFSSLAPRFVGEFQKAIDYIGDLAEFERQFTQHAEIARSFGNYKISVHSGSDKFKVFPAIGKLTGQYLHLKTAGTSWLESVHVMAEKEPELYRAMHNCALAHFGEATKLYHISANPQHLPNLESLSDKDLPSMLKLDEGRQVLHITYGSILGDTALRQKFFDALFKNEEYYHERLKAHFEKHLSLLGIHACKKIS